MNARTLIGLVASLALAGASPAFAQTSDAAATPAKPEASTAPGAAAGYSPELVAKGDALFHASANCYACHGSNAQGLVGPNLTDAEWKYGSTDGRRAERPQAASACSRRQCATSRATRCITRGITSR